MVAVIMRALRLSGWLVLALVAGCAKASSASRAESTTAASSATTVPAAKAPTSTASAATVASAVSAAAASPSGRAATAAPPTGMVRLPAAIFLMGAYHAVGNPEERPAHEAIVPSFYLDRTEVTMATYRKCLVAGACSKTHVEHRFCNEKDKDHEDHPVNCVDLHQAAAYCAWAGKRLPTEREWEYAASGGEERRRFSWGEQDPEPMKRACYDHPGGSCPVGKFAPGAFDLLDMTGNVWEWTQSEFTPYPSRDLGDPIVETRWYVYRGGSWSRRFPKWMRTQLRNRYEPKMFSASIGLRCARTVLPLECPAETAARDDRCVRVTGTPRCEPGFAWDDSRKTCVLGGLGTADLEARLAHGFGAGGAIGNAGRTASATAPRGAGAATAPAAAGESGPPPITRTRSPQYDDDCKRHWPGTPAAYLFTGGLNFPARMPTLRAAGCKPRDMGLQWTSACCPG
jgi:formylglycine-generating enzyme required for sulfatase activity